MSKTSNTGIIDNSILHTSICNILTLFSCQSLSQLDVSVSLMLTCLSSTLIVQALIFHDRMPILGRCQKTGLDEGTLDRVQMLL